ADFELVIVDNASTDDTPAICCRYTDPRVRYLRFDTLVNQAGNFNRCLDEARGEYLTLLHSDDFFFPGFLESRGQHLDRDREIDFVFGAAIVVDAEGKSLHPAQKWSEDRRFARGQLVEALLYGCCIFPVSLMVRTEVARSVGPFRTNWTWGHDWEW